MASRSSCLAEETPPTSAKVTSGPDANPRVDICLRPSLYEPAFCSAMSPSVRGGLQAGARPSLLSFSVRFSLSLKTRVPSRISACRDLLVETSTLRGSVVWAWQGWGAVDR